MNVANYLTRINYDGSRQPSAQSLADLQRAHLFTVPFENLDIALQREIVLDETRLYRKIVEQRRGGFCYELNGLFAGLLSAFGFQVSMLSARVHENGEVGPEFDHMVLLVQLERRWLVDVGFGDSFFEPLALDDFSPQTRRGRVFQIARNGDQWRMIEKTPDGNMANGYSFTLQPRQLADFAPMCVYQQTSPDSIFTQKRLCTRATTNGRVTLSHSRLTIVEGGQRSEVPVDGGADFNAKLAEHFGIRLEMPRRRKEALPQ